jgi:hypothetical protein
MSIRLLLFLSLLVTFANEVFSQDITNEINYFEGDSLAELDTKYREDQFYFGVTYNLLLNKPGETKTSGLTGGLSVGYLRDMPINKRRNVAVAVGLGLSFDEYGNTLFIGENSSEESIFSVIDEDDIDFDRNRFSIASLEIPLELRWRSSTDETYRFWRVHAGVRLGYAYWYKSSLRQTNNNINQTDIADFYAYYGLNPFFTDAVTRQGDSVDVSTLKLGLLFYFL